jgi:ADP-ribosylglycohydrolase
MESIPQQDRYRGSLLGLGIGDALGAPLEFKTPGTFEPIDAMIGGGPHAVEPGEWTDDTSMALCLAESLIECGGFDPRDQMERYVRWWREGYNSSKGYCFDIGNTIRGALSRFEATGEPFSGSTDAHSAGNGSIMRLAPVPLYFAGDPAEAIRMSAESSRTTHGAPEAVDACRYLAALLVGAVHGATKEELLSDHHSPAAGLWDSEPLAPRIAEIAAGSYKGKSALLIQGSGYVVKSLEAALWAFHSTDNFRDGCLAAVNLGDDADTTGAVYGQIAGAYYGAGGIPEEWLEQVFWREKIGGIVDRLASVQTMSGDPTPR